MYDFACSLQQMNGTIMRFAQQPVVAITVPAWRHGKCDRSGKNGNQCGKNENQCGK